MKLIEIYDCDTNKVIDNLKIKKTKNYQKDIINYLENKNYRLFLQGTISYSSNNVYWLAHNRITKENLKIWYREKELVNFKEDNNLVLDYLGNDSWDRPVYKVNQSNIFVKDTNLGKFSMPNLCYSCPKDNFFGEPDYDFDLSKYNSISVISSKGYDIPSNMNIYNKNEELSL